MSNIKKYIIDYDWKASIEIEIDHDLMTEEKLHQINNFWSDSEYRLNKHGSVLNAVLIMLAQHALLIAISSDLNAYGSDYWKSSLPSNVRAFLYAYQ